MTFTAGRENGRRRPRGYADWRPHARTLDLLDGVRVVLGEYHEHLPLTIRQIFYRLVGLEIIGKTERDYNRLCEHLNRARRARLIPFDEIRDDGIVTVDAAWYAGVEDFDDETARRARAYQRDRQEFQPHRLELWCEAGGMLQQLATVAGAYSVPVYSCGGFASLSAVRAIADRALARDVPTVLLHVGDLDPSGESIFESIAQDVRAFVHADRILQTIDVEAVRVALTRDQVEEYELPTAPAKTTDARSKTWTGDTCQLEALAPDLLAEIVDAAIRERMQRDVLARVLDLEAGDRARLLALPAGES